MTSDGDIWWEPPFRGSEAQQLVAALDRQRATFRFKVDGLDTAGLRATFGASSLTLGALMKHLAAMEDYTFTVKLTGQPLGEPWTGWGWDGSNDWELESAADDEPDDLYRLYDAAVGRSRERLGAFLGGDTLDQPVHATGPDGQPVLLRRLLCDFLEEYGRHTGHADLIREAVDGRVGEDPTPGWRPVGAAAG
jgi:uncharacterized protein DUF664